MQLTFFKETYYVNNGDPLCL